MRDSGGKGPSGRGEGEDVRRVGRAKTGPLPSAGRQSGGGRKIGPRPEGAEGVGFSHRRAASQASSLSAGGSPSCWSLRA